MKILKHYSTLSIGDICPKCELGKGLKESSAFQIGLTGWENYEFLHCPICGANFVGKNGSWAYLEYHSPDFHKG